MCSGEKRFRPVVKTVNAILSLTPKFLFIFWETNFFGKLSPLKLVTREMTNSKILDFKKLARFETSSGNRQKNVTTSSRWEGSEVLAVRVGRNV